MKETSSAARAALEAIAKERGYLEPKAVVEAAKDPSSPLHEYFEWDQKAGHEEYLLIQARTLIRSVKIEVTIHEHVLSAPKYVKDPRQKNNPGYAPVLVVKKDEDAAREVFLMELKRAQAMLKRAQKVGVALGRENELDSPIERVQILIDAVEAEEEEAQKATG